MKAVIITVAGVSSRFNQGVPDHARQLKAIYTEGTVKDTLLYHLLQKCLFADHIIIVGGYRFDELKEYCSRLAPAMNDRISLVFNDHYEDLSSGYSLFLGLREAFKYNPDELLFIEGDLDVDSESFDAIVASTKSVLSYNSEPIYANKAVVLYKDEAEHYHYVFSSCHGLLSIEGAFSCILNSGQIWKFTDMKALYRANERFFNESRNDTNLKIIHNYLDEGVQVVLLGLKRWTNCNTKEDYYRILSFWEEEA